MMKFQHFRTALSIVAVVPLLLSFSVSAADRPADKKPFVQVPDTASVEARKYLESLPDPATLPAAPAADDVAGWKRVWQANEKANEPRVKSTLDRYEPMLAERMLGVVPVIDIKPKGWKDDGKVLVYLHGGGYTFNSARSRLPSGVLAADSTGLRVVAVDYTVAPVGTWQKVTDEVLAVFEGLQKEGYQLKDIAIYGESAGGGLAAGSVLKMRDKDLGMPAAVVLWSPWADITDSGDSAITMKQFDPNHIYDTHLKTSADAYADPKDQKHPYVSPIYGDFSKGFPPTLIQGGTREIFLSNFVRLYRVMDAGGAVAVLDLYDGMPHNFQFRISDGVESKTALQKTKVFLREHLGK